APAALVPGERAGTVAVGVSLEALQALRRRTFTTATLFAALFTPIAVLGTVLLTRAITRPLTVLASAADAIARGDFHTTVDGRTPRRGTGDDDRRHRPLLATAARPDHQRARLRPAQLRPNFVPGRALRPGPAARRDRGPARAPAPEPAPRSHGEGRSGPPDV